MNQQALTPQTSLQGGRYTILRTLGQGGFGITYLAMQRGLEREVVVKEFFMKSFCDRVSGTQVTLGTAGSREEVSRYRDKFLKEARNIAQLHHPNIVQVFDIFEENGTAYYVMEYARGGSLADKVAREGHLQEAVATRYIRQVASALVYLHQRSMSHLDVKPANIMLDSDDNALLIDFGLAKQNDGQSGEQISSTPVGISEGYAAPEQYRMGGIGRFSPATDVYALAATFYFLLTGERPPVAADVVEDGVPVAKLNRAKVSQKAILAIEQAMKGRRKDRLQGMEAFLYCLSEGAQSGKETMLIEPQAKLDSKPNHGANSSKVEIKSAKDKSSTPIIGYLGCFLFLLSIVVCILSFNDSYNMSTSASDIDTTAIDTMVLGNEVQTFTVNGVSFEMMPVDGGMFIMGATSEQKNDSEDDEFPTHKVILNSFFIGKTEVTQALWEAVMGENPSRFQGLNLPVENVSWENCQTFIYKLSELTGKSFSFPTEAEWEFAARGGKRRKGYKYSGSNNLDEVAWYGANSKNQTHDVGLKRPNELGLFDMSGNVCEWCSDGYDNYSNTSQTNPSGSDSNTRRVVRGGGWRYDARCCRVSNRDNHYEGYQDYDYGLRLVLR